jgi:hypothetical protein
MKFIFLEKVVNKQYIFLVFFFIAFDVISQHHAADNQYLNKVSESTLESTVDFSWNGGRLSEALNKLHAENSIKFSFSNSNIADISVSPCTYSAIKLSELLTILFKNTGFNYVLIGKIVAVYKDDSNVGELSASSDSTESPQNSPSVQHKPVYSSSNPPVLSRRDRIMINRIYRKELRWAARLRKQNQSDDSDSLNKNKKDKPSAPVYQQEQFKYFVAANLGLHVNYPRYKNNSVLSWQNDLLWNHRSENHVLPEFLFGVSVRGFMFSTGMQFHKVTLHHSYKEQKKGPPKNPPTPSGQNENPSVFVTERYSALSIPVKFQYGKSIKNIWGGIGGGACLNFMGGNESMNNKLKKYYNESTTGPKEDYSDHYNKVLASVFAEISAGYKLKNNILLTGGISYIHFFSPVYENTLFSLTFNSMVYSIGACYKFNNFPKRR